MYAEGIHGQFFHGSVHICFKNTSGCQECSNCALLIKHQFKHGTFMLRDFRLVVSAVRIHHLIVDFSELLSPLLREHILPPVRLLC
jgi:hypothetical protein